MFRGVCATVLATSLLAGCSAASDTSPSSAEKARESEGSARTRTASSTAPKVSPETVAPIVSISSALSDAENSSAAEPCDTVFHATQVDAKGNDDAVFRAIGGKYDNSLSDAAPPYDLAGKFGPQDGTPPTIICGFGPYDPPIDWKDTSPTNAYLLFVFYPTAKSVPASLSPKPTATVTGANGVTVVSQARANPKLVPFMRQLVQHVSP